MRPRTRPPVPVVGGVRRIGRRFGPALALLVGAAAAHGDVVHLQGGRRLIGRAEEQGDLVRVAMGGGTVAVSRAIVERIERAPLPRDAFVARRDALREGDVRGALDLADFAERQGLAADAGEVLASAVRWAPDDPEVLAARRRWVVHVREIPDDPDGDAALAAAAGAGARIHTTAHFRIAHPNDAADARTRGEALESAWRKVHEVAHALGLDTAVVRRRLDVIVHPDRAAWLRGVGLDEARAGGMTAAFDAATGRVHFAPIDSLPQARAAAAALAQERKAVETARARADEAEAEAARVVATARDLPSSERDRRREIEAWGIAARKSIEAERNRIHDWAGDIAVRERAFGEDLAAEDRASITHEACHQVAFATGICRMGQPLWLLEGLATLFENTSRATIRPDATNPGRLADLRRARDGGRVTGVADIVTDRIFRTEGADLRVAYAESWALAHFLARRRPAALAACIRAAPPPGSGPATADARLAEFLAAVGADLAEIERAFADHVRGL